MNQDRFEGTCRQFAGKLKAGWCGLTGDTNGVVNGERDQRAGMMQVRCGISKESNDRQMREFLLRNRDWNHFDYPAQR